MLHSVPKTFLIISFFVCVTSWRSWLQNKKVWWMIWCHMLRGIKIFRWRKLRGNKKRKRRAWNRKMDWGNVMSLYMQRCYLILCFIERFHVYILLRYMDMTNSSTGTTSTLLVSTEKSVNNSNNFGASAKPDNEGNYVLHEYFCAWLEWKSLNAAQ